MCAVLFDGPVGEQALPEASLLMALGVEEIHLLQKVHQIIRASPGKAQGLFEKIWQILKEENKEELICNQCPGFEHRDEWDATQMRSSLLPPPSHDTGSVKALHKRGIGLRRKVAKKKEVSKVAKKKDRQNIKSRKVERKQTGVENSKKPRKLGKKEKQKEKKKNLKTKKASKKKNRVKNKKILKMKKTKQKRKVKQGNRQRTVYVEKIEDLNNCTSLWAELTNVGLGVATILRKQVMDIDLVEKVNSLAGKFHKKQR